jgi:Fe-only nitrogenase accessory protein AnfO
VLIASYVGRNGQVEDFFEPGSLRLFEDVSGNWICVNEVLLELREDMPLSVLKVLFRKSVEELGEARVFLAREFRGVLRVFLEELEFRVWKAKGTLEVQLADAARQEREAVAAQETADAELPQPEAVGDPADGLFRFDLIARLSEGGCHVSRDMLMPFLETVAFARLEVVCDHVPRWFPVELPELGLEARVPDVAPGQEMTVMVFPKDGGRSSPPGRRSGRGGCGCGG